MKDAKDITWEPSGSKGVRFTHIIINGEVITLTKELTLELMSGSKIRLPIRTSIVIDDPADLVSLLCYPEGCFFHTSRSRNAIAGGKVVPVVNMKGSMTILAAQELIEKDYVPYLLWASTKVPGELQQLRRIEIMTADIAFSKVITSNEESIQGWSYIDLPSYTLDRLHIEDEDYQHDNRYIVQLEDALKSGRITIDQLDKAIKDVEETTNNKEGD